MDNCRACDNRCGDRQVCAELCQDGYDLGTSCEAPTIVASANADTDFSVRFNPSIAGTHTFSCGTPDAIPVKWLRISPSSPPSGISLYRLMTTKGTYALEVYVSCPGDGGSVTSLGCNDAAISGKDMPSVSDLTLQGGNTYFIAVGRHETTGMESFQIEFD